MPSADVAKLVHRAAEVLLALGAREVYVFGSFARGATVGGSDIDVAVKGLPPERFFRAMAQAADAVGRAIDLVDLDEDTPFTRYLRESSDLRRVA